MSQPNMMQIPEADLVALAKAFLDGAKFISTMCPKPIYACKLCGVMLLDVDDPLNGNYHAIHCPIHVASKVMREHTNAEICRVIKKQSERRNQLPEVRIHQTDGTKFVRLEQLESEVLAHLAEDDVTKPVIATAHICVHCKYEFRFGVQLIDPAMHATDCKYRIDTEANHGKPSPDTVADTSKLQEYASHDDKSSY